MKEKKTVQGKRKSINLSLHVGNHCAWEIQRNTHVFVWYQLEHPLEGVSRAQAEVPHSRGLKSNYIFNLNVRK